MKPFTFVSTFLLAAGACSLSASAQTTLASSESYVAVGRVTPTAAATSASSASFEARVEAGLASSLQTSASANYGLWAGVATTEPKLITSAPVVLGVTPDAGSKDGGDAVLVFGFNLEDGTATATVLFGGAPASGVGVTSNTRLQATTPVGVNVYGNPLGSAAVSVTNGLGSGLLTDAFVYAPALVQASPARVGQSFDMDVHVRTGNLFQASFGGSIPGVAVPIPPLDGAAELLSPIIPITPFLTATADVTTLTFPIPNNPAFVGLIAEFQSAALDLSAGLAGSFTNLLALTILP